MPVIRRLGRSRRWMPGGPGRAAAAAQLVPVTVPPACSGASSKFADALAAAGGRTRKAARGPSPPQSSACAPEASESRSSGPP